MTKRWSAVLILLLLGAGFLAILLSGGIAGGESRHPKIALLGKEQKVFDWSRDACEPVDLPDQAPRAYRDFQGRVRMFASNYVTRGFIGPSLNAVKHTCNVALKSDLDPRPSQFDNREWLSAPYTLDGRNIYALVHQEYHGEGPRSACPSGSYNGCLYNAITLASSSDGGTSFSHRPPPQHLVAGPPYRYVPDSGPFGLFQPSNIMRKDGYFYTLLQAERFRKLNRGTCLMRSRNLADPNSWRGWDGDGFSIRFANPYRQRVDPEKHLCKPIAFQQIGVMSQSLTYNTYLDRYVLIGPSGKRLPGKRRGVTWGFYFSVSKDLIHWSDRRLIAQTELPWTHRCRDRDSVTYPSLLDPSSRSRNFETTGRRPYLYFTRIHYDGCRMSLNRDLIRRRVEFKK
jgi:hypothetical protein